MKTETQNEEICCPLIEVDKWDNQILEWNDKLFAKERVRTFFYMPLNFSQVMKRFDAKMREHNISFPDYLCLSDHTSKWNMDLYLAVDKEIPGINHARLSGKMFTKVYEGPFKETGNWCKDFQRIAAEKGYKIGKMYMWYTVCPKCAKKYGKNYVFIFGQIE
ncbi:hydrolase [Parabacteroides sp. FAFU027]|uniref:hydrolase n=1 Tax=Parabacteroides sp. FAFU027 TaxID=2922715 RepID=UPI001FAEBE26|nr:hydrolase [Parabacteroides sp. FAFU027]